MPTTAQIARYAANPTSGPQMSDGTTIQPL